MVTHLPYGLFPGSESFLGKYFYPSQRSVSFAFGVLLKRFDYGPECLWKSVDILVCVGIQQAHHTSLRAGSAGSAPSGRSHGGADLTHPAKKP